MSKIIFDTQLEKRTEFENTYTERNTGFKREEKWSRPQPSEVHERINHTPGMRYFEKNQMTNEGRICRRNKRAKQDKLPLWVICALFSIIGAFATFTPICSQSFTYGRQLVDISFTAIDLLNFGNGVNFDFGNMKNMKIYLITTLSFAVSLVASLLMKEKIAERPYLFIIAGIVAVAGMLIPFGLSTVMTLITEYRSICFSVQLISAMALIILNIVPMKGFIEERKNMTPKRNTF